LRDGTGRPRAAEAPARSRPTCHALMAAPIRPQRTAVVVWPATVAAAPHVSDASPSTSTALPCAVLPSPTV
jgi:hypothetical protein